MSTSEPIQSDSRPVILHVIVGLNGGGAEAVLYNLIRAARQFNHKVISLTDRGKYGDLIEELGIPVETLGLASSYPSPRKIARLYRLVRESGADAVQTWMYHADLLGGLAARKAGIDAVVWGLHYSAPHSPQTKWTTRAIISLTKRLSSRLPSRIISCSTASKVAHVEIGYPAERITVVHNGYDVNAFKPAAKARAAIRTEFGIRDDQLLLGCVARYHPQKDHRNLIFAFEKVAKVRSDAHLLLVGPDLTTENSEIMALLAELGMSNRVTLAGPRDDIPAVMNGLDLHVLGSAFGEAFPNVVSEAMSCGTPCVATDVGDSATIVGDTGRIVPPRDNQALAAAILDMAAQLSDQSLRVACRDRILGNFTLEHMVTGYTQVWCDSIAATGDLGKL